jgi:hypothetical protein
MSRSPNIITDASQDATRTLTRPITSQVRAIHRKDGQRGSRQPQPSTTILNIADVLGAGDVGSPRIATAIRLRRRHADRVRDGEG